MRFRQASTGAAPHAPAPPRQSRETWRSREPVKVVGEVVVWHRHPRDALQAMKDSAERLRPQGVEAIDD